MTKNHFCGETMSEFGFSKPDIKGRLSVQKYQSLYEELSEKEKKLKHLEYQKLVSAERLKNKIESEKKLSEEIQKNHEILYADTITEAKKKYYQGQYVDALKLFSKCQARFPDHGTEISEWIKLVDESLMHENQKIESNRQEKKRLLLEAKELVFKESLDEALLKMEEAGIISELTDDEQAFADEILEARRQRSASLKVESGLKEAKNREQLQYLYGAKYNLIRFKYEAALDLIQKGMLLGANKELNDLYDVTVNEIKAKENAEKAEIEIKAKYREQLRIKYLQQYSAGNYSDSLAVLRELKIISSSQEKEEWDKIIKEIEKKHEIFKQEEIRESELKKQEALIREKQFAMQWKAINELLLHRKWEEAAHQLMDLEIQYPEKNEIQKKLVHIQGAIKLSEISLAEKEQKLRSDEDLARKLWKECLNLMDEREFSKASSKCLEILSMKVSFQDLAREMLLTCIKEEDKIRTAALSDQEKTRHIEFLLFELNEQIAHRKLPEARLTIKKLMDHGCDKKSFTDLENKYFELMQKKEAERELEEQRLQEHRREFESLKFEFDRLYQDGYSRQLNIVYDKLEKYASSSSEFSEMFHHFKIKYLEIVEKYRLKCQAASSLKFKIEESLTDKTTRLDQLKDLYKVLVENDVITGDERNIFEHQLKQRINELEKDRIHWLNQQKRIENYLLEIEYLLDSAQVADEECFERVRELFMPDCSIPKKEELLQKFLQLSKRQHELIREMNMARQEKEKGERVAELLKQLNAFINEKQYEAAQPLVFELAKEGMYKDAVADIQKMLLQLIFEREKSGLEILKKNAEVETFHKKESLREASLKRTQAMSYLERGLNEYDALNTVKAIEYWKEGLEIDPGCSVLEIMIANAKRRQMRDALQKSIQTEKITQFEEDWKLFMTKSLILAEEAKIESIDAELIMLEQRVLKNEELSDLHGEFRQEWINKLLIQGHARMNQKLWSAAKNLYTVINYFDQANIEAKNGILLAEAKLGEKK